MKGLQPAAICLLFLPVLFWGAASGQSTWAIGGSRESRDTEYGGIAKKWHERKGPDMKGKSGLGFSASYINFAADDDGGSVTELSSNLLLGVNISVFLDREVSVVFSMGYNKGVLVEEYKGQELEWGEFQQLPLMLSLRWHSGVDKQTIGYILGGVSYFINDVDLYSYLEKLYFNDLHVLSVKNSTGFHLGFGAEHFFGSTASIYAEYSHAWSRMKFRYNLDVQIEGSTNINPDILSIGYRRYF